MVTDQNANIIARHDHAPFGQEIQSGVGVRTSVWGASDNVNQKFTGQERDGETNLDFFQARYLSSGLGRFMSPDPGNAGADPTNPQGWNGYAYVLNNPLNMVDPSGASSCNIFNVTYEGSGTLPSTDASAPSAGNPYQVSNSAGQLVNTGFGPGSPDLAAGEASYVQQVVVPGYLSGIGSKYPSLVQFFPAAGSSSTTIYYGAAEIAKISAESVGQSSCAEDWDSCGLAILGELGRRVPAMEKSVGVFAGASVAAGAGIGAALVATGSTAIGSGSILAGQTPVLGGLRFTGQYAGASGYATFSVPSSAYSWGLNVTWLQSQILTGQTFLLGAGRAGTAAEVAYLTGKGVGYVPIGPFLVPPLPPELCTQPAVPSDDCARLVTARE